MSARQAPFQTISAAAWRLAWMLFAHPVAAAGNVAALDQKLLLPVFGGDEDLLNAALDELLVMPLHFGSEDEPWSAFQILAAARFEPRDDEVLVHFRFHRDFLRLLGTHAGSKSAGWRPVSSSQRH